MTHRVSPLQVTRVRLPIASQPRVPLHPGGWALALDMLCPGRTAWIFCLHTHILARGAPAGWGPPGKAEKAPSRGWEVGRALLTADHSFQSLVQTGVSSSIWPPATVFTLEAKAGGISTATQSNLGASRRRPASWSWCPAFMLSRPLSCWDLVCPRLHTSFLLPRP